MAKAHFWLGILVGLLIGVFVLVCGVGYWVWAHHMFVIGITNRGALVFGIGLVAALVVFGVVLRRVLLR